MLDDPQIMGDKKVGQLVLFFDVLHQIDYLGLDRYIQGTDRLITDHKLRMKGDRSRNAHTLTLAAGKFVGIPKDMLGTQPHALDQLFHFPVDLFLTHLRVVNPERLRQDLKYRLSRIQRRIRILENDLHLLS